MRFLALIPPLACSIASVRALKSNDEYDFSILDPDSAFGSPYGGYSRATASRLAALSLRLPYVAEELADFEPSYSQVRDDQGTQYTCRVYHEDELHPETLEDSMFEVPMAHDTAGPAARHGASGGSTASQEVESDRDNDHMEVNQQGAAPTTQSEEARSIALALEVDRRLMQLSGMCAQYHVGWWSYEWCHTDAVTQFHVEINDADNGSSDLRVADLTSLGEFSERRIELDRVSATEEKKGEGSTKPKKASTDYLEGREEIARVIEVFEDGDICEETGKPREVEATLRCCSHRLIAKNKGGVLLNNRAYKTDLVSVHEVVESPTSKCRYELTLCTPLLCAGNDAAQHRQDGSNSSQKRRMEASVEEVGKMSVKEVLEMTFGTEGKVCIQSERGGWWVYELCPGRSVRQFHEETVVGLFPLPSRTTTVDSEHILGEFDISAHHTPKENEWQHVVNSTHPTISSNPKSRRSSTPTTQAGNGAYFFQEYSGGDVCDHADVTDSAIKAGEVGEGFIERSTTVRYTCGTKLSLTTKEDSTCHYVAVATVPALCHHPFFKAPVSKRQVMKCLPGP